MEEEKEGREKTLKEWSRERNRIQSLILDPLSLCELIYRRERLY